MSESLTKTTKIIKANAYAASAGTAINSSSVDMSMFESVTFRAEMITANASNFCNLATSDDDVTFVDLAGTKVTPGTNGDCAAIEVVKPLERYIRMEVDRGGANTAVGTIYADVKGAHNMPVTHDTVVDVETHISPAEGTA